MGQCLPLISHLIFLVVVGPEWTMSLWELLDRFLKLHWVSFFQRMLERVYSHSLTQKVTVIQGLQFLRFHMWHICWAIRKIIMSFNISTNHRGIRNCSSSVGQSLALPDWLSSGVCLVTGTKSCSGKTVARAAKIKKIWNCTSLRIPFEV